MITEMSRVGKKGTVVIPADLRQRFGIEEGSFVIAEEREDGIFLRPATLPPVEMYTPERIAEFLLNSAVDAEDYNDAVAEVRRLGLDPEKILHDKPPGA